MSYRGFHYRVTLPLLVLIGSWYALQGGTLAIILPVLLLCSIVVVFTFPWDNWAIRRGIWDFPDERLLFRIDRLPIEELAFFILQTLHASLLTLGLCERDPSSRYSGIVIVDTDVALCIATFTVAWIVIGVLSRRILMQRSRYSYAYHLIVWFLPVIIVQWLFAEPILSARLDVIMISTMLIGTVLTIADVWAIRHRIWFFDHNQITGKFIGGILPWEEAAFFYMTSLLVSQSILLLVPETLR